MLNDIYTPFGVVKLNPLTTSPPKNKIDAMGREFIKDIILNAEKKLVAQMIKEIELKYAR